MTFSTLCLTFTSVAFLPERRSKLKLWYYNIVSNNIILVNTLVEEPSTQGLHVFSSFVFTGVFLAPRSVKKLEFSKKMTKKIYAE